MTAREEEHEVLEPGRVQRVPLVAIETGEVDAEYFRPERTSERTDVADGRGRGPVVAAVPVVAVVADMLPPRGWWCR